MAGALPAGQEKRETKEMEMIMFTRFRETRAARRQARALARLLSADRLCTNVSRRDISQGERGRARKCALALSLQRQFPGAEVSVGVTIASISVGDGPDRRYTQWKMEPDTYDFRTAFDANIRSRAPEPGRYCFTRDTRSS